MMRARLWSVGRGGMAAQVVFGACAAGDGQALGDHQGRGAMELAVVRKAELERRKGQHGFLQRFVVQVGHAGLGKTWARFATGRVAVKTVGGRGIEELRDGAHGEMRGGLGPAGMAARDVLEVGVARGCRGGRRAVDVIHGVYNINISMKRRAR